MFNFFLQFNYNSFIIKINQGFKSPGTYTYGDKKKKNVSSSVYFLKNIRGRRIVIEDVRRDKGLAVGSLVRSPQNTDL